MTTSEKSSLENLWNSPDPVLFAEKKLNITLDKWQRDYIKTKGNTAVRAGRQSGKSFAESLRVALFAILNDGTTTLVTAAVERQGVLLFEKIKSQIIILAKHMIVGNPTMHQIVLRNKSRVLMHPSGRDAYGLRGYTAHKVVIDEAHFVPEAVFVAIMPMLATTNGTLDLLSTPLGNKGFFYDAFMAGSNFSTFHVRSEDCPRISKEFLARQRREMTNLQYRQEYEAEFLDALQALFPADLIDKCMTIDKTQPKENSYMGVDIARYGGDENAFVVVDMQDREHVFARYVETTERVSTTETTAKIIQFTKDFKLRKVYIDDGGIGGAVFDYLIEKPELKRKLVGINNASRSIIHDKSRGKRLMKEDLYGNLKRMMEQGHIQLLKDEALRQSLLSIQFEYSDEGNLKIWGRYSHITEALIRACWCVKSANLNIWVASSRDGKIEGVFEQ